MTKRLLPLLLLIFPLAIIADPFIGEYSGYADDDQYYLKIDAAGKNSYKGLMIVSGEQIPFSAKKVGKRLKGQINDYGDVYGFNASIRKDGTLLFKDEDGDSVVFSKAVPGTVAKAQSSGYHANSQPPYGAPPSGASTYGAQPYGGPNSSTPNTGGPIYGAAPQNNPNVNEWMPPYQGQPNYGAPPPQTNQPYGNQQDSWNAQPYGAPAAGIYGNQSGMSHRAIFFNRVKLPAQQVQAMESDYQTQIQDGRYWYDNHSGAWGVEGGPTAGFIQAGLGLPGPMPADISGGGTGIFINGREIHPLDQQGLQQLFGITYQGRYWLDAQGNLGQEGGPAITNIVAAIQNAQQNQQGTSAGGNSGSSVTHGYDSNYGARGTSSGGIYSGRTASGKSVFWYPGM